MIDALIVARLFALLPVLPFLFVSLTATILILMVAPWSDRDIEPRSPAERG